MRFVLFDEKGNVKVFKSDVKLEEYLKKHEGIFYLVGVSGKWVNITKIKSENGDFINTAEKHVEFLD